MKTKTIKQKIMFFASPHELYEMLMDSKKHANFTQSKATISRDIGGKFTAYDGYIIGINLELIQDKKIVQKWRASDWPSNFYSKVTFKFKKTKDGCVLEFTQSNVPASHYDNISQGWHDFYWHRIKEFTKK